MYQLLPDFKYAPLITAILIPAILGFLAYTVVFRLPFFETLSKGTIGLQMIILPNTLLALVLVFMASAVWQNSSVAHQSLLNERLSIKHLHDLPIEPKEIKIQTEKNLELYVSLVKNQEWGAKRNSVKVSSVDTVLRHLASNTWRIENNIRGNSSSTSLGLNIQSEYWRLLDQLENAREKRLELGNLTHFSYLQKWIIIYLLSFVAAMAVAIAHRDRSPRVAKIALSILCSSLTIVYLIVSLFIHPYRGPTALLPDLM
jgi:hypothetical protein